MKETKPLWEEYQSLLEQIKLRKLNYDLEKSEEFTELNGWRIDDYATELPSESPGQPYPKGSWEIACEILRNYEFPDPSLITGVYVPDIPLQERYMILRGRFWWFTFLFGAKIGKVSDETRRVDEITHARIWGYSYQTLEGHFEMGEITFEIWKYLESGKVEFRIHAYSKPTHIPNIFYRIGFRLFGRRLQVKFARTALARMRQW